jgi:hypothetical protein
MQMTQMTNFMYGIALLEAALATPETWNAWRNTRG